MSIDKKIHPQKDRPDPRKPANNPDNAMDSPEEVARHSDEKIDEDFPGFPHHPATPEDVKKKKSNC